LNTKTEQKNTTKEQVATVTRATRRPQCRDISKLERPAQTRTDSGQTPAFPVRRSPLHKNLPPSQPKNACPPWHQLSQMGD